MYVCMHACMYAWGPSKLAFVDVGLTRDTCMYVCMYVCMYAWGPSKLAFVDVGLTQNTLDIACYDVVRDGALLDP
jgi:hypothetical protein